MRKKGYDGLHGTQHPRIEEIEANSVVKKPEEERAGK